MSDPKIQHYIPKLILRNFGVGKKDQLWVYDKLTGRSFRTNVKNVASENRFYDFEVSGTPYSLEGSLSRLESQAKPIIAKVLQSNGVSSIEPHERKLLAAFLAVQFTRTKAFRMQWAALPGLLRTKVESMGTTVAADSQAAELIKDPTEDQLKLQTGKMLMEAPARFGPHFENKVWFVATTVPSDPFVLGDNPISLQNDIDTGPYGNLGLAVQGIQIYFPLSSTRALAMWCGSLAEQIEQSARTIRQFPAAALAAAGVKNPESILSLDHALQTGSGLRYEASHVMNFNSLQVGRSERYVFSSTNDFSLVKRMIDDHPHLKGGQRMVSG